MTTMTVNENTELSSHALAESLSRLTLTFNPAIHLVILPPLPDMMSEKLEKTEHYDPLSADQMKPTKDFTATEFFAPEPLPSVISAGILPSSSAVYHDSPEKDFSSEPLKPATELLTGFDPNKYLATPNTSKPADVADEEDTAHDDKTAEEDSDDSTPMRIDDGEIRDSRDVMQMLRELSVLRGN